MTVLASISLVIAILLVASGSASSQELLRINANHHCAVEPGTVPNEVHAFPPTPAAEEAVREIVELVGLGSSGWRLRASAVEKARAFIEPTTGDRVIVYNEDFIRDLRDESGSVWANVAILAHEVAHHLNLHLQTSDVDRRHIEELEADRFAGYVLFHKGASEEATERVFMALGGGGTHPPTPDRVAAAKNGWLRARGHDTIAVDAPPQQPTVLDFALFGEHHRSSVDHAGGLRAGPGFGFRLGGKLKYAGQANMGVIVSFRFPDGRILLPHPNEWRYRLAETGGVVTGSGMFPFHGEVALHTVEIDPIPYYVLNLAPTNLYMTYALLAEARIFVDNKEISRSDPVPLFVRW